MPTPFLFRGARGSATRPAAVAGGAPWAVNASAPNVNDGTVIDADLVNELVANLRQVATALGSDLTGTSDDVLRAAIQTWVYAQVGQTAGLGVGTAPGDLVQLDPTTGKLPAVDASLLLNLPGVAGASASIWSGKKWTAVGDSITYFGLYTGPLATQLGATLTNLGASGAALSTSSSGSGSIHDQIASIPSDADLITVFGGINDWYRPSTLGAVGDTTLATFYGAVAKFCQDILTAHPNAILFWITPYDTSASKDNAVNTSSITLDQYVQAIKTVAGLYGCPVIDVHGESGISGYTATQYLGDGLHPNAAGGERLAAYIYDRLQLIRPTGNTTGQVSTPVFSPSAGTYASAQSVAIACATGGATIHYTTDGSTPTSASPVYSAPVSIAATSTVNAIAIKSGLSDSAVATAVYTITATEAATPTFSPVAGSYAGTQTVAISCATSGATIHYTTDGSTPTSASPVYASPLTVAASATLKAYSVASGLLDSAVASAAYTITMAQVATPTFSPVAGTYAGTRTVSIACATSGATIRYTTDGSTPNGASPIYSSPISVAVSTTIKAIGIATGMTNSAVGTAAYVIGPAFDPATLSPSFWIDAADLTTLYTDIGHSSAVSADGQAVAYASDKSGTGHHLLQGSSGQRPVYHTDGTLGWLALDGGNQNLPLAAGGSVALTGGAWSIAYAARKSDTTGNGSVLLGTSGGDYNYAGDNPVGLGFPSINASGSTVGGSGDTATMTSDHVVVIRVSGGVATLYLNGVSVGGGAVGDFAYTGLATFGNAGFIYGGRVYEAMIVPRALTTGEVASLTTWLGAKAGMTL